MSSREYDEGKHLFAYQMSDGFQSLKSNLFQCYNGTRINGLVDHSFTREGNSEPSLSEEGTLLGLNLEDHTWWQINILHTLPLITPEFEFGSRRRHDAEIVKRFDKGHGKKCSKVESKPSLSISKTESSFVIIIISRKLKE